MIEGEKYFTAASCGLTNPEKKQTTGELLVAQQAEILALKRELLEWGGHTKGCNTYYDGLPVVGWDKEGHRNCTCGWLARRKQLQKDIEKGE